MQAAKLWDQATTIVGLSAKWGLNAHDLLGQVANPGRGLDTAVQYALNHPGTVQASAGAKAGAAIGALPQSQAAGSVPVGVASTTGAIGTALAGAPLFHSGSVQGSGPLNPPSPGQAAGSLGSPAGMVGRFASKLAPLAAGVPTPSVLNAVLHGGPPQPILPPYGGSPAASRSPTSVSPYSSGQINNLIAGIDAKTSNPSWPAILGPQPTVNGMPVSPGVSAPLSGNGPVSTFLTAAHAPPNAASLPKTVTPAYGQAQNAAPAILPQTPSPASPQASQTPGGPYAASNALVHGLVGISNALSTGKKAGNAYDVGQAALDTAAGALGKQAAAAKGPSGPPQISSPAGLTVKGAALSPVQQKYANMIISIGSQLKAPPQAIQAALYAAMGETSLGADTAALSQPNSAGYVGLMQADSHTWPNPGDAAGMIHAFYTGQGPQGQTDFHNGAINWVKQGVTNPAEIAVRTEVPSIWPSNAYAGQWPGGQQAGLNEAAALLKAAGSGGGGGGAQLRSGGNPFTGTMGGNGFNVVPLNSAGNPNFQTTAASGSGAAGTVPQGAGASAPSGAASSSAAPSSGGATASTPGATPAQNALLSSILGTSSSTSNVNPVLSYYLKNTSPSIWSVGGGSGASGGNPFAISLAHASLQDLAGVHTKISDPLTSSSSKKLGLLK